MIISVAAFIGVAALVAGGLSIFGGMGDNRTEDRLDVMSGKKAPEGAAGESKGITKGELIRAGKSGAGAALNALFKRFGSLSRLVEQADSPIRLDTILLISLGLGMLGVAIGLIVHSPVPLLPVFGLMAATLPLMWLRFRRGRRFKKFAKQLPEALELIGRALRSGHSLSSGMHVVVEEMPAPISQEFAAAYEEQNLGVPIEQALKNMLKRMPNLDLKFFVTAVAIQRQTGGDLAEILDKIGHVVRERFRIWGQIQALTGEGRISGIVLMAMPIGIFFAVYYLNPDYVMLLFSEEMGRQMIAVAAFMQVLGAICIKKIIDIKV